MPGIYLHTPFCKKRCHYCNFYSSTVLAYKPEFLQALFQEMEWQKDYLGGDTVQSIYIGGGTPSLLSAAELETVFNRLFSTFSVSSDAEITLEANPDDMTAAYLHSLRHLPINRLSIGIQSFNDHDLRYLNRIHSANQALNCIKAALDSGFENLSIDLIYGTPTLSDESWVENLEVIFRCGIPHVSAYALTVEPQTALETLIQKGKVQSVDDEAMVRHFHLLCDWMETHQYTHYEISNFCRENRYSRHNTAYWSGSPYLGLGPSAHSFNGESRQWNPSDMKTYLRAGQQQRIPFELEWLDRNKKFNEYVMTSLRTIWGCDSGLVRERFGQQCSNHLLDQAGPWIKNGYMTLQGQVLRLTRPGKLHADRISADLFIVN